MKIKLAATILSVMLVGITGAAQTVPNDSTASEFSTYVPQSVLDEKVIVNGDTVSIILPQRNFGRFDRGLYNFLFIPKGQWSFGLTASYGEFDADDVQLLSALKDFDFNGKLYSIRPTIGYFIRNNQSVGVKFNYTHGEGTLGSMAVDIGDDINFSIHDVGYRSNTYSIGLFYRNYVGLSTYKRFAIFNEVDVSYGHGSQRFVRNYNEVPRETCTTINEGSINFSPGLCMFITDQVSFNVSFGVFGLHFRDESQRTNGVEEGSRFSSGANFKFNLFNINFGIGVHI